MPISEQLAAWIRIHAATITALKGTSDTFVPWMDADQYKRISSALSAIGQPGYLTTDEKRYLR